MTGTAGNRLHRGYKLIHRHTCHNTCFHLESRYHRTLVFRHLLKLVEKAEAVVEAVVENPAHPEYIQLNQEPQKADQA